MSDKPTKAKKTKKSAAREGVLASLPTTRPERLGRRSTAKSAAPKREPAKPARAAGASKPKATRSTAASRAASAEKAQRAARPAAPKPPLPPPAPRAQPRKPAGPPKGPELVTTAIQAAGEIAHIGITAGGRALKRAAKRLPRP